MPKLKTHKGAQARFRITGSGKILRAKQGGNHLRRKKSPRVKRSYHQMLPMHPADQRRIQRLLPYRVK